MKDLVINNQPIEFTVISDEFYTTTLDVAKVFNKRHKNILRIINQDIEFFNELTIEPVKYKDKKGEMRKYFLLSQGAFSLLVMGFRGKQAMQWKVEYIKAFELLRKEYYNSFKNLKGLIPENVFNSLKPFAPYGKKSDVNGLPRITLVHGYFRSINGSLSNGKLVAKFTQNSLIELDKIDSIKTIGYKGATNE